MTILQLAICDGWLRKEYQNNKTELKSKLGVMSRAATLAYKVNILFAHLFINIVSQSNLKLFIE